MKTCSLGCGRARGFTLVELLVSITIVSLLTGMAVAMMSSSKERARQTLCSNRLREIGTALGVYHSAKGAFPIGCIEQRPMANMTSRRQLAWSAYLLPYLDQRSLHEQLDLSKAFDAPENAIAASTVLDVYLCPSSGRTDFQPQGRGAIDYGGIFGERIVSPNNPPKGVMLWDTTINRDQIKDGQGFTLIVSEDHGFKQAQWINGTNLFDQAFAINAAPALENDIRSNHGGGANALFCDGHVAFLGEAMDLKVLAAICTRAGGEVVDDAKLKYSE